MPSRGGRGAGRAPPVAMLKKALPNFLLHAVSAVQKHI